MRAQEDTMWISSARSHTTAVDASREGAAESNWTNLREKASEHRSSSRTTASLLKY